MSFGAPKKKPDDPSLLRKQSSLTASSLSPSASVGSFRNNNNLQRGNSSASLKNNNNASASSKSSSPVARRNFHSSTTSSRQRQQQHQNHPTHQRKSSSILSRQSSMSTSFMVNNNSFTSNNSNSNQMMKFNHGNSIRSNVVDNHHLFELRGEKYSMASDLFGFTDQMDPNPFEYIEQVNEGDDPVSSPLRNMLARLQNGEVPSSCQLTPDTYDSLAVMERMNHTRRLLDSMIVERRECLDHMERGKEIYKAVFGRSIVSNKVVDDMLGLSSSSSKKKHKNTRSRTADGEDHDEDDFDLRHAKGEPKLQTPEVMMNKKKKNNSPPLAAESMSKTPSIALNLSDSFEHSLMMSSDTARYVEKNDANNSGKSNKKKETVFDRLSRTPPPPSWIAEANLASKKVIPVRLRDGNATPKRGFAVRSVNNAFYQRKMLEKIGTPTNEDEEEKEKEKEKLRQQQIEEKRKQKQEKKEEKKKKKNKNTNHTEENDDIDQIPTRFKDEDYSSSDFNQNNQHQQHIDPTDTPQIIRTPLPENAYRNYLNNSYSSQDGNEITILSSPENNTPSNKTHENNNHSDNHYVIEYTSPARLPIGRLQTNLSSKQQKREHNQDNDRQVPPRDRDRIVKTGVTGMSGDSMMPQIHRMQDPATNFGDNLEWTGGVSWG